MDIEKLIHCLQCCVRVDAHNIGCDDCGLEYCGPECQQLCGTAATALSTLQAENKRLNKIVCSIPTTPDSGRTVSQYDKEMSMCAYLDDLEAENEKLRADLEYEREHANAYHEECSRWEAENKKLRAELEQVKAEKDAAVESIPHECKTCVYHTVFFNGCTLDHDCTNPDGGCSNNYDRWKWRGPHKED